MKAIKITEQTDRKEFLSIIENLQNDLQEKEKRLTESQSAISQKNTLIGVLEYKLRAALYQQYARRSEKLHVDGQLSLFDEADLPDLTPAEEETSTEATTTVSAHKRKKSSRKPLPSDLARVYKEHDLPEERKICPCGNKKVCIGKDVSEQLEVIPAQMYVIVNAKLKYACKSCEGNIEQAKAPAQAIPKSKAGPGLLAHIIVSKFCDHLPLYRQESILKRSGIDISRATLCQWVMKCGDLLLPLINIMQDDLLNYDVSYADETPVQVLKEPGRTAAQKSYIWLYGGGAPDQFCWIYRYHPGRSGCYVKTFFEDYSGYLHTDGYSGYNALAEDGITLVACMAHARRKFFEVTKIAKSRRGLAHVALEFIQSLYRIEKQAREQQLNTEELKDLRLKKSKPIAEQFKLWLHEKQNKVPPKSPISKAIKYTINQWPKLMRYLEDGRLEIDNNRTERAIKPFVIGRKNWLFYDRPRGAEAGARIYSLIETCKVHGIDPYAYFRYILKHIPQAKTAEAYEKLLPYNCDQTSMLHELAHDRQMVTKIMASTAEAD